MRTTVIVIVLSQLIFSSGDLLARHYLGKHGFHLNSFAAPWFLIYILTKVVAIAGQLYILSNVKIGPTMALFGATSITVSSVLGLLLLHETLTTTGYIGITLAVAAFVILALR